MKTIEHFYSADLSWVENFAKQYDGKVEGNFIIVPEDIQSGTRYFLDCGEGIIAYYINVEYKKNLHLIQKNSSNDFVGFYYNLTDGEATVSVHNSMYNVSRWQYNLSIIDGTLESDYNVTKGSKTFALCIFIKKSSIREYAIKNRLKLPNIDEIINPEKNTIIRFDRMSNESFHILDDLRKKKVGGPIFDLNLVGTVHMLIANYLKKLAAKRIIIQTVNQPDLTSIIATQMYLIENIEDHFPSIKLLAEKANMSESKFKTLFNKITGSTPNMFFIENKLLRAKELLETKQFSISQISDQLNFTNNSYFASKFKEYFGVSPKTFVQDL
ncbi:AraC-type DNA-binding protein [Flavobacterium sp. CF108]|uniref:helix-turn-helix domain-containing protein n=1 Tax=unclassified Flavobacterium TaxID=196869 RepID=UPI0008C9C11D|nr:MULTISPECIES: AraC family transcriptional regulator [unclassified Flavobacterium]SEO62705.1 AraC-type DNA-binding protein [Flavobacterium sp. fv08]SHI07117.1 AraC-type DNA-binding protein [Flavobacterium sp. CF108]